MGGSIGEIEVAVREGVNGLLPAEFADVFALCHPRVGVKPGAAGALRENALKPDALVCEFSATTVMRSQSSRRGLVPASFEGTARHSVRPRLARVCEARRDCGAGIKDEAYEVVQRLRRGELAQS